MAVTGKRSLNIPLIDRIFNMKYFIYFILMLGLSKASENNIAGKELRVIIAHLPPTVTIIRNSSGHLVGFGGILYEQLDWMSKLLNFNFNMIVAREPFAGVLMSDGNWTGMIGQLSRGEADLACAAFALNIRRYQAMDYAAYMHGDAIGILTHYPKSQTFFSGIVMIFSTNVWICIGLSIVAVVVCWYFIIWVKRRHLGIDSKGTSLNSLGDIFMYCFGTLTTQGMYYRSGHRSVVVLAAIWAIFAFVIVNIYSSCLASYTSLTYKRSEIETFEDLANRPEYGLSTLKGSINEIAVLSAEKGPLKQIGNRLRSCGQDCSLIDFDKIQNKVLGDQQAAILTTSVMKYMTTQTINNKSECRLTLAKELMAYQHMYLGVPKNSPYIQELNQASFWWSDMGFYDYWSRVENYGMRKCLLKYDHRGVSYEMLPQNTPLKLKQFYLAFMILLIGCLLGIFQFIRERLIGPLRDRPIVV